MRLIDADTVITIQVYDDMTEETDTKEMTIADAIDKWSDEGCPPTIDAKPVRYSRWIKNNNGTYSCSKCHSWIPDEQHYYARYCLFCGAKMDKGDKR